MIDLNETIRWYERGFRDAEADKLPIFGDKRGRYVALLDDPPDHVLENEHEIGKAYYEGYEAYLEYLCESHKGVTKVEWWPSKERRP